MIGSYVQNIHICVMDFFYTNLSSVLASLGELTPPKVDFKQCILQTVDIKQAMDIVFVGQSRFF